MHGGLTREGLKKLELQIDAQLNGRDPKSLDLEKQLKDLMGKYSYEVEYYNMMHRKMHYHNKYGIPTPLQYKAGLSLANFMANGVPANNNTNIPEGKHPVTTQSMDAFIKSFESLLQGNQSKEDIRRVTAYDPIQREWVRSLNQELLSKTSLFSQSNGSKSDGHPHNAKGTASTRDQKNENYCGFESGFLTGKRF